MSTESLESTEAATAARPGWSLVGKKKEKEPSVTDRGKRLLAMMDPVAPATPEAALPPVPVAEVDPSAAMPAAAAPILPPSLVPVAAAQPVAEAEIPAVPSDTPIAAVAEVVADVAPAPVGGPPPVPAEVLAAMEATSPIAVTTTIPTVPAAPVLVAPPVERPVVPPIPIDLPTTNALPPVPSEDTATVVLEPNALPVDDSDGIEVIGEMDEVEPVSLGDIPPVPAEAMAPTEPLPIPGLPDVEPPVSEISPLEETKEVDSIPEVPGIPPVSLPSSFAPEALPDPLASLPPVPGMPSASPAPVPAPAPGAPAAVVPAPIELPTIDLPPVIAEALAPAPADAPEEAVEPQANVEEKDEVELVAPPAESNFDLPPLPEALSIAEAPKAEIELPELPELPKAETASPEVELPAAITDAAVPEAVEPVTPVQSPFGVIDPPASHDAEEVPLAEVSEPALSIPPIAKTTAIPIPVQSPFSVASEEPKAEADAPEAVASEEDTNVTPELPGVEMPTGLGALPSAALAGVIASPFASAEPPAPRPAPPEEAEVPESSPVIASPFQIAEPQVEPVQAELPTEPVAEIEVPAEEEPPAQIVEEPAPVAASPFQLATPELPVIPSPVVTDGPTVLPPLAEEEAPLSPLAEAQKKIEALAEKTSAPDYVERPVLPKVEAVTSPTEMLVRTPGAFLEEVEEESTEEAVAEIPELIEEEIAPLELPTVEAKVEPDPIEIEEPVSEEVVEEAVEEEPVAEIAPVEIPAFDAPEPEVEVEAEAAILEEPEIEEPADEVIEEIEPAAEIEEPTEEGFEEVAASEETDIVRLLSPEEVAAKEEEKLGAAAATAAAAVAAGVPEVLIGTAFDGSYDDEVVNLISGETLSRTLRLPVADAVAGNFEVRLGFPDCSSYIFATVEIGGGHGRLRTGMVVNGCRAESVHGEAVLGSNLHELNLAFFLDGARLQMRAAVVRPSRMGDQLVLRGLGSFIHPELHGQLSLMPIPDIREEQTEI